MKKILIADDDEYCASLLKYFLKEKGYEVIHVEDGSNAIFTAKEENPDLIILDIMMPAYTGVDVVKIMRQEETLKQTPIFLLSSLSKGSTVTAEVEVLIDSYITKPFDPNEVLSQIETTLEGKALEKKRDHQT